jgi:UDP-3-O-[3-hydroxymyristoyl] glucosamine N-acyltransferase LpxD
VIRATLHLHEIRKLLAITGEGDCRLDGIAPLDELHDHCLYFSSRGMTGDLRESLAQRHGCVVLVPEDSAQGEQLGSSRVLSVADPRAAMARILGFVRDSGRQAAWLQSRMIAPSAVVSPMAMVEGNVHLGEEVVIEPFCTIRSGVAIGKATVVHSGARIFAGVRIGEHSVIGANAVIGSEGYGFVRDEQGNKLRIPHLGGVSIGSRVEIGALSVVQSGTLAPTVIADHVKIDDNVEVGHNAHVKRGASITGGVVLGGSSVIGEEAWLGINASVRNGHSVGARALVGMDASIQECLPDDAVARAPRPTVGNRRADSDKNLIGFEPL